MEATMDPTKKPLAKYSNEVFRKGSLVLSFISILMIVALFLRMETINRRTKMNELRILDVESCIKTHALTNRRNENVEGKTTTSTVSDEKSSKFRRSLTPDSNKPLTMEDVRSEIIKQISQMQPASFCQPSEKVCVQGPPGKKGSRGPRGRRGPPGPKGKRGEQGIMGLPGRHGKQGIRGDKGLEGEKGRKGASGPRGMMGQKGEPGESASLPDVTIAPETKTVTENQTARFYCSARGHPKPVVTWSRVNGSSAVERVNINQNGLLEVLKSNINDSGEYMCSAVNVLGKDSKTAKLFVEVAPRLTKEPDLFLSFEKGTVAEIACEALSYPSSVITWKRILMALPKGRYSVHNGTLRIRDFSKTDSGLYVCTATNKLGSVSAVTTLTLGYKEKPDNNGWTLIARFSNSDSKNWMRYDGKWWYDLQIANGATNNPSENNDMISPAFWSVSGREIKITRSDDPSHTPLLQTTGNCLGGQTFRSKITSYGDFRHGTVWASDQCLGSCTVQYGGQYKSTDGFQQAKCSGNIQSADKIGFWCDWDDGDGSVMMIGGGGTNCGRADHGIGITERDAASFVDHGSSEREYDFGYEAWAGNAVSQCYSLNLWIR